MSAERKFKKLKASEATLAGMYSNLLFHFEKRKWPKAFAWLLFPVLIFGFLLAKSADSFRNPAIALLFYGFNLLFVYLPLIAASQLETGTMIAILFYLNAVFLFSIYLVYLKYAKKEMPKLRTKKEINKNKAVALLLGSWFIGLEITVLLDIYLLAKFLYDLLLALL